MSAVAMALALAFGAPPAPPSGPAAAETPLHILVLDDSGSMELQYDAHGYGLAAPELFRRVLGDGLAVFLLAQGGPRGDVPRLGPADFLAYPRENGTYYEAAIRMAIREAEGALAKDPGRRVEVLLVTDAEPSDADARAAIDKALAAHPELAFSCVLLGTSDEGDLCRGRATAVPDGFAMAQALATDLARGLGSIPKWGRLGPTQKTTTIPLGRFVRKAHVLLLGARAGQDFAAEVVDAGGAHAVDVAHTRPLLPPDLLRMQAVAQGLTPPGGALPVGPSPRLALGTVTVDRPTASGDIELRLTRTDGDVAWGVLLEYDLAAEVLAPTSVMPVPGAPASIPVKAHLTHAGAHVDDHMALDALGLTSPELVVTPECVTTCPAARTLKLTLDDHGWATAEVPVEDGVERYRFEARFASATADLRSPPASTTISRSATTVATPLPSTPTATPIPPPAPPAPAPAAAPTVASTPTPAPAPAPTPTTRITNWIPPVLDLPDYQIEDTELGYALTVVSFGGKTLTGAEILAEKLGAALVVDGRELPMTLNGDRFEVRFPVGSPGARDVRVRLITPEGPLDSNTDRMDVLPDARVRLAPATDEGVVEAGCGATDRCRELDWSGSQRLDGLALTATRRAGTWPDARVTLRRGDDSWALERDVALTIPPGPNGLMSVCIAPPGCVDAPDDAHELIDLGPADPRLATADRTSRTRVLATVEPSSWLECNLWWVVLVTTGLLIGFIVYGYVRPRAFPLGAVVHVASGGEGERRLARDPGRPLRAVPHGRKGFYRTATCAFDGSGFTVKKSKSHVVMLRAERGSQIALVARGAQVERRARGAWVPIDRQAERYLLSGATYRINGSFFFKVLA